LTRDDRRGTRTWRTARGHWHQTASGTTHSTNIHEKKGWLKLKARRRREHKTVPVSHYIESSDCVENNTLGERRGAGGHGCLAYHNGRRQTKRTFILSQSFKAFWTHACVWSVMLRSASRQRLRWDQNGHAGFDHPRSMRAAMLSVKSAPSGGWREYIAPDARQSARAASAIRLTVQTLYDEAGSERRCRPVELQQLRSEESPQSRELERQQAAARLNGRAGEETVVASERRPPGMRPSAT